MSSSQAARFQIERLSASNQQLRTVLELLRNASTPALVSLISRLQNSATLEEAIDQIEGASLLLTSNMDRTDGERES